jgi:hypothetical protein
MMIARLLISRDPSGSERGLIAEDDSVTALMERHYVEPSLRLPIDEIREAELQQFKIEIRAI